MGESGHLHRCLWIWKGSHKTGAGVCCRVGAMSTVNSWSNLVWKPIIEHPKTPFLCERNLSYYQPSAQFWGVCLSVFCLRSLLRKSERKILCSSNSVPSSFLKMCLRSWSRTSPRSCSSCRWRKGFSVTRSTAHLKQQFFLAPMLCKPNLETTIKKYTSLDTSVRNAWSLNGKCLKMERSSCLESSSVFQLFKLK